MVEYATMILVGVFFEEHTVRFLLRQCSLLSQSEFLAVADLNLVQYPVPSLPFHVQLSLHIVR
jgi:hypothetical protein